MSKFFLYNNAIMLDNYEAFKNGCLELVAIRKMPEHTFYKNESIYSLPILNDLWTNCRSQEEQEIMRFIGKLAPCCTEIETEEAANNYCNSDNNGFLGIDFKDQNIQTHKCITNSISYTNWICHYQTNFEQLLSSLKPVMTKNFERSFRSLSPEMQKSILDEFEKAANRGLATRYFPDTKIIKDVSVSNKCKVLELRVYQPVALRVYFNEINSIVYLASIEQKSNPDQNADIKKAEKLLISINS